MKFTITRHSNDNMCYFNTNAYGSDFVNDFPKVAVIRRKFGAANCQFLCVSVCVCVCVCARPVYITLDEVSDLVGEMRFHTSTVKTSSACPYAYLYASPLHVHCHGNRVAVVAASRGRAACYAGRQAGKKFTYQDICIFLCVCTSALSRQTYDLVLTSRAHCCELLFRCSRYMRGRISFSMLVAFRLEQ